MTRVSGSVELDISARNLARAIGTELIAQGLGEAVAAAVKAAVSAELAGYFGGQQRKDPLPMDIYDRPAEPEGGHRGPPRFGGVDDTGIHYDTPGETS